MDSTLFYFVGEGQVGHGSLKNGTTIIDDYLFFNSVFPGKGVAYHGCCYTYFERQESGHGY